MYNSIDLEASESITTENTIGSQMFINHQQFLLGHKNVTFAWKNNTDSSTCDPAKYNITSTLCNGSVIHVYQVDGINLQYNISNDKLRFGNSSEPVFFYLDALDSEGHVCQQLVPNSIVIEESGK